MRTEKKTLLLMKFLMLSLRKNGFLQAGADYVVGWKVLILMIPKRVVVSFKEVASSLLTPRIKKVAQNNPRY